MSTIEDLLNNILTATYGRDVRGSIHNAIKECYDDVTDAKTKAERATDSANRAAGDATDAKGYADTATEAANRAAGDANSAALAANNAASRIERGLSNATEAYNNATTAYDKAVAAKTAADQAKKAADDAKTAADDAKDNSIAALGKAVNALDMATNFNNRVQSVAQAAEAAENEYTDTLKPKFNAWEETIKQVVQQGDDAERQGNTAERQGNTAAGQGDDAARKGNAAERQGNAAERQGNAAERQGNAAERQGNIVAGYINYVDTIIKTTWPTLETSVRNAEEAATIAAGNATNAAGDATNAANDAIGAASIIENMTVSSEEVGPTGSASVSFVDLDDHKDIHFVLKTGATGDPLKVIGEPFDTLEDLESEIYDPEIGDIYAVGSEPPRTMYRWTGSEWVSEGLLSVSEISGLNEYEVLDLYNDPEASYSANKYLNANGLSVLANATNGIKADLNRKVDKVSGKGLSTNDFTDDYKNLIEYNRDRINNLNSTKVSKYPGKDLSTNDFTNVYKTKLDNSLSVTLEDIIEIPTESSVSNNDLLICRTSSYTYKVSVSKFISSIVELYSFKTASDVATVSEVEEYFGIN